tara:strand:- start:1570 stop:1887 length:318 start_codon:yes stop_codon:yes gene_type:complete
MRKSKYYYDKDRNLDNSKMSNKINPKMMMSKEDLNIPDYYIGTKYKYEARKVVEDWNLSYNTGTAVSYLLRAGKKREEGMSNTDKHIEDIQKAINHLNFEIDKLS